MKIIPLCGTDAAYGRHRRRGEVPCEPCREAHSEVSSRYRTQKAEREAARQGALEKLAKIHPSTFRLLFSEELHARGQLSTQGLKHAGGIA